VPEPVAVPEPVRAPEVHPAVRVRGQVRVPPVQVRVPPVQVRPQAPVGLHKRPPAHPAALSRLAVPALGVQPCPPHIFGGPSQIRCRPGCSDTEISTIFHRSSAGGQAASCDSDAAHSPALLFRCGALIHPPPAGRWRQVAGFPPSSQTRRRRSLTATAREATLCRRNVSSQAVCAEVVERAS
jgi:hypothetical protein